MNKNGRNKLISIVVPIVVSVILFWFVVDFILNRKLTNDTLNPTTDYFIIVALCCNIVAAIAVFLAINIKFDKTLWRWKPRHLSLSDASTKFVGCIFAVFGPCFRMPPPRYEYEDLNNKPLR